MDTSTNIFNVNMLQFIGCIHNIFDFNDPRIVKWVFSTYITQDEYIYYMNIIHEGSIEIKN